MSQKRHNLTLSVTLESKQKGGLHSSMPFHKVHEDAKKQLADNDRGSYCSQDIQWPSEYLRNEELK